MTKSRTCCNLTSICKDKFAKNALKAFIKGSNTLTSILAISCTSISILTKALAMVLTFVLILGSLGLYTDVDLQKAIKLALKLFI